tara:strand:- start:918 stop:1208 length:291 start_codon:yes stop_codon:yes gene_type:complete
MAVDRELLMKNMRIARDEKLAKSDIELIKLLESSSSYSAYNTAKADWVAYRTALRDLPASFPDDIEEDFSNVPAMPLSPTETAAAAVVVNNLPDGE